jgi:cytochrome P450
MSDIEATRTPHVFPLDESPFAPDISLAEGRRRLAAAEADVVTDEIGAVVGFLSEDDVDAVLTDRRFAAVAMPTLGLSGVTDGPLHDLWSLLMNGKDGADHKRIRSAVAREFTPRSVERHRPMIVDVCERMADRLAAAADADGGVADLWSDYALPVSARVSSGLVGIPEADADRAAEWSFDLARAFLPFMSPEQRAKAEAAAVAFTGYVDRLFPRLVADPGDDIGSRLAACQLAVELDDAETKALAANLVFGGLETTAKAISTGVYHLDRHAKYRELVGRPDLIPGAVSELLRYLPPSPVLARLVPEDLVCRHVQLRAGQVASPNLLAACHDPARYENPEELDFTRDPGKQLAFGAGVHYCLGANLAKLELSIAFETLTRCFPDLTVAAADDQITWDVGSFAGVVALPVRPG